MPENGEREKEKDCLDKVKAEVDKLGVLIPPCCYDRAHRVGKVYTDANGKVTKPMIVRLVSWKARTDIYRARKRDSSTRFYMDLTKRRFSLKKFAYEKIKDNGLVDFVFADVNNNIGFRLKNGQFKFFNSEEELEKILGELG